MLLFAEIINYKTMGSNTYDSIVNINNGLFNVNFKKFTH